MKLKMKTKNRLFKLAVIFLCLSFQGKVSLAADIVGQVRARYRSGRIRDLNNAVVNLHRSDTNTLVNSFITNSNGMYYMYDISPGSYILRVKGQSRQINISSQDQRIRVQEILVDR
jgi:hypothetical protein